MMKSIVSIFLMGLAFYFSAKLVPGVEINGYWAALLAAILITIVNATLGNILRVFTFIFDILTFGLVSFIISVLMIMLVDNWMSSFKTSGFISAAILAIVVTLVQLLIDKIIFSKEKNH